MSGTPLQILLLNQYYPPDTSATAQMAREVARALTAAGHGVTVLAGRPSYQPTEQSPWRPLARAVAEGVGVERVGSCAFSRATLPGRIANYLSYLALACLRGPFVRADLVLAMTDPPVVVVMGAAVAALRRIPLVYNVRDLHPDMAVAAGLIRPGVLLRLWAGLHRWALRRAARVIVLGEDMRRRVIAHGVPPGRVAVVRDGAVVPARPPVRDTVLSAEVRCGFAFVVLHAGNLGFAGAWDTLVSAAQLAGEGVGFVFVGDGAIVGDLRARVGRLQNVRLLPSRRAEEVPRLLAAGDLLVVTVRRGLEGLVVPSKLYPVLAAGRPVLLVAADDSDAAAIVRETGCGWVASPDDPAAVAAVVLEARRNPVELEARAQRAWTAAGRFDRRRLLVDLVRVVEGAV